MTPTGAQLHHAILRDIVDRGRAPTVDELGRRFASSDEAIRKALRRLADDHAATSANGGAIAPGARWASRRWSAAR
jgi:DNA-binding GntR family transcriptional regulator